MEWSAAAGTGMDMTTTTSTAAAQQHTGQSAAVSNVVLVKTLLDIAHKECSMLMKQNLAVGRSYFLSWEPLSVEDHNQAEF